MPNGVFLSCTVMATLQPIGLVTCGLFCSYILFLPFPLYKRKKKVERYILLSGDFAVDLMGKEHMKTLENQYFTYTLAAVIGSFILTVAVVVEEGIVWHSYA